MLAEGTESETVLDITNGLLGESSWESGGYSGSAWVVANGGDLDMFLLLEKDCILPGLNQQLVWVIKESLSINHHCIWTQALLLSSVLLSSFPLSLYTWGIMHALLYNSWQDRNTTYSPDPSINFGKSSTLALPCRISYTAVNKGKSFSIP